MPVLKDPKREEFALLIAQGRGKRDSAIAAGFAASGASVRASALLKEPQVTDRIAELREAKANVFVEQGRGAQYMTPPKIDRGWLEAEAIRNYEAATKPGDRKWWFDSLAKMAGAYIATTVNANLNASATSSDALDALPVEHMEALVGAIRALRDARTAALPPPASSGTIIEAVADDAADDDADAAG
jgi:hypothetical protein